MENLTRYLKDNPTNDYVKNKPEVEKLLRELMNIEDDKAICYNSENIIKLAEILDKAIEIGKASNAVKTLIDSSGNERHGKIIIGGAGLLNVDLALLKRQSNSGGIMLIDDSYVSNTSNRVTNEDILRTQMESSEPYSEYPDGKANRRERRTQERKKKRK